MRAAVAVEKGTGELLFRKDKLLQGLVRMCILHCRPGEEADGLWGGATDILLPSLLPPNRAQTSPFLLEAPGPPVSPLQDRLRPYPVLPSPVQNHFVHAAGLELAFDGRLGHLLWAVTGRNDAQRCRICNIRMRTLGLLL